MYRLDDVPQDRAARCDTSDVRGSARDDLYWNSRGRVTLAPCTYSGKITGAVIAGNARILTEPLECRAASTALAKKYGFMLPLTRNAWRLLHRETKADEVYIAIEPIAEGA